MENELLIGGEICLYGDVGDTWGDGFLVPDVALALAAHGDGDVTVRINSGGGIATDGQAMFSLFKSHPGKVTMIVDGVAASAASLIYMAGDVRQMRQGAMLMIHDPATITIGNAAAHATAGAFLDKLADNYAGVYARASGKTPEDARTIMKAETWLTADDSVKQGFATAVLDDAVAKMAAFDYRGVYMHAPATLPQRAARPRRELTTAATTKLEARLAAVEKQIEAADTATIAAVQMAMRQRSLSIR